jgi:hypothetical protein
VPDYIHPRDFHRLARAVSAPDLDTVHMMHTMNWVQAVTCAGVLDYYFRIKPEMLEEVLSTLHKCACEMHGGLIEAEGIGGLLLSPPVDNPRNVIEYALYSVHHEVRPRL